MRDRTKRRKRLAWLSTLLLLTFIAGVVFANVQGFLWFDGFVAVRGQPVMAAPIFRWELPGGPYPTPTLPTHPLGPFDPVDGYGWHPSSTAVNGSFPTWDPESGRFTPGNVNLFQWIMFDNANERGRPDLVGADGIFRNPPVLIAPFLADSRDYRASRASFQMFITEFASGRGADIFFEIRNHVPETMVPPTGTHGGWARIVSVSASASPFNDDFLHGNNRNTLLAGNPPPIPPSGALPERDPLEVAAWYNALTAGTAWLKAAAPPHYLVPGADGIVNRTNILAIHDLVGQVFPPNTTRTVGIRLTVDDHAEHLYRVGPYEVAVPESPGSENYVYEVRSPERRPVETSPNPEGAFLPPDTPPVVPGTGILSDEITMFQDEDDSWWYYTGYEFWIQVEFEWFFFEQ